MRLFWPLAILLVSILASPQAAGAQAGAARMAYIKPQYLPPAELARVLGVQDVEGRGVLTWDDGEDTHRVEIRRNDAANLLMVLGDSEDVAAVEAMVKAADVAPRQIMVEARIVEVDASKALDAGVDWSRLRTDLLTGYNWFRTRDKSRQESPFGSFSNQNKDTRSIARLDANAGLFDALRVLEEKGAATFRDAPRILTLNNHRATILDGQRVTYVTRYSSFTNLFETDTLDAGLTLSVLPSLGESGYLTLDVRAELTSVSGAISGSPVKDGQIVENIIVARDGEMVLLGGFLRTVEQRTRRRFPLLGTVLPFLFSREVSNRSRRESFVAIIPRVVDLAAPLDENTRRTIEGR